ncbi:MAG: hypothetical protein ACE5EZ_02035 [Thermodesulfobacteriota bacterium]
MSFYTKIETQLKNKQYVVAALVELRKRGEITKCTIDEKKEIMEVDRSGDAIKVARNKKGAFEVGGDNRVVQAFSNKLKQFYALESIKDNLPLDFEISEEQETIDGEIKILLKG